MSVDEDTCWICFEDNDDLISVCKCPSKVHKRCLARWQVQNIGEDEENKCRFCKQSFPNWKETFEIKNVETAVFKLCCNGRVSKVSVRLDSMEEFEETIRKLFRLPREQEFNIDYHCTVPDGSGSNITIKSQGLQMHQFQSAVYLANGNRNNIEKNENNSQATQSEPKDSFFRHIYKFFFSKN